MIEHPVFERFRPHRLAEDDWLGARFVGGTIHNRPGRNDETFEWITMLQAVLDAPGRFTMLELGAGYGRWAIWSALAARRIGIENIEVRLVEAEPQHAAWARENLRTNGLAANARLYAAALSSSPDPVPFAIDAPAQQYDALSWYGQSVVTWATDPVSPTGESYFGHPVYRNRWIGQIYVPTITLEEAAAGLDRIDLVDADLQGAETELIPAMELLTERVRLVHIGTHSVEIEAALRDAFRAAGWICQADYSLQAEHDTPFGRIAFGDGVQTWRNPRL